MLAKNAPTQPNDVRDADKQGEHVEAIKLATNMDQQYYYCVCVFSDNTMYTSTMLLFVCFVCLLLLLTLSIPFLFVIYLTQFFTILISYIMGCQTQLVS